MRTFAAILFMVLCTALASTADAETYRWVTEDGTVSFTDDEKQIPKRYRAAAAEVDLKTMSADRFTPTKAAETAEYAAALNARLERLRAMTAGRHERGVRVDDLPLQPITDTRRVDRELLKGGGRIVIVRERRTVDGINKPMYVVYDEAGEEMIVSPFPIGYRSAPRGEIVPTLDRR